MIARVTFFFHKLLFAYWNKHLLPVFFLHSSPPRRSQSDFHRPGRLPGCSFGVSYWCSCHCINLPTAFSASIYHCGQGDSHSSWWDTTPGERDGVGKCIHNTSLSVCNTPHADRYQNSWVMCALYCKHRDKCCEYICSVLFWFLILTKLFSISLSVMSIYGFCF